MKRIFIKTSFYGTLPLIYAVGLLPDKVRYFLSDALAWILFYLIRYRRSVVLENLATAFPDYTHAMRYNIAKLFYRHFTDVFLEIAMGFVISKEKFRKRFSYQNYEAILELQTYGKPIVCVMGHLGNWEWSGFGTVFFSEALFSIYALYRPLKVDVIDRFMKKNRTRFGVFLLSMFEAPRFIAAHQSAQHIYAFIADQSPVPEYARWLTFLGQTTACFTGPEKIARKFGLPVFYVGMVRVKRGFYKLGCVPITNDASITEPGFVITQFYRLLEADIKQNPEQWLWSHRRWKHKPPQNQLKTDNLPLNNL